jgi:hypothetical protein
MEITRVSKLTGMLHSFDLNVTKEQLLDYEKGMDVKYAFPNLTPAEREFFVTGITEDEIKKWGNGVGL